MKNIKLSSAELRLVVGGSTLVGGSNPILGIEAGIISFLKGTGNVSLVISVEKLFSGLNSLLGLGGKQQVPGTGTGSVPAVPGTIKVA